MSRIVQIPPVAAPGAQGGTGRMEVLLTLVDATGTAIPASDASNTGIVHGLGVHVVTDQQYDLELSTQAELTETTYYRVVVRQGRDEWRRDVQIPTGDGSPLTWAQLLAFEDPVTAGLAWASRLLPASATDGQFAAYDAATGLWEASTVAPGAGLGAGDDAALLGSGTATDGQVLTADGLGGAAWEAAAGGAGATNLSIANVGVSTIDIASDTGTDATIPAATAAAAGLATAAQIGKLDGIAAGATAAGAAGDAFASSHPGGNQHIDWTADQGATNLHAGNIPDLSGTYATAERGVTNGDSHTQPEASITFTDITTGNATVLAHGFIPKLSGVTEQYFNGNGGWTTPSGSGSGTGSGLVIIEASSIGGSMTCQFTENTSF